MRDPQAHMHKRETRTHPNYTPSWQVLPSTKYHINSAPIAKQQMQYFLRARHGCDFFNSFAYLYR